MGHDVVICFAAYCKPVDWWHGHRAFLCDGLGTPTLTSGLWLWISLKTSGYETFTSMAHQGICSTGVKTTYASTSTSSLCQRISSHSHLLWILMTFDKYLLNQLVSLLIDRVLFLAFWPVKIQSTDNSNLLAHQYPQSCRDSVIQYSPEQNTIYIMDLINNVPNLDKRDLALTKPSTMPCPSFQMCYDLDGHFKMNLWSSYPSGSKYIQYYTMLYTWITWILPSQDPEAKEYPNHVVQETTSEPGLCHISITSAPGVVVTQQISHTCVHKQRTTKEQTCAPILHKLNFLHRIHICIFLQQYTCGTHLYTCHL